MISADLRARLTAAGCPEYPDDAPLILASWAALEALTRSVVAQHGEVGSDVAEHGALVVVFHDGIRHHSRWQSTLAEAVTLAWEQWAEVRRG